MAIADRLAVMRAGRIVQIGRGEDLYRSPSHPFVAEFLGRVNRIERSQAAISDGAIVFGGTAIACPSAWMNHATLLLRPEDVQVGPRDGAGFGTSGWGVAQVRQRTFLGDRVQLRLAVTGQPALLADVSRDTPFQVGDDVGIRMHPDRLMTSQEEVAP